MIAEKVSDGEDNPLDDLATNKFDALSVLTSLT